MGYNRQWLENVGSEDSNGRAIWCFGHSHRHAALPEVRDWGGQWFNRSTDLAASLNSPRAMAFAALGASLVLEVDASHVAARKLLEDAGARLFHLYKAVSRPGWAWFETVLGYDNPRLPEALLRAGQLTKNREWI
jgi:hypothetical protein